MKKLLFTFAFLFLPFTVFAQTWLKVPVKTTCFAHPDIKVCRNPDLSALPLVVKRWGNGIRTTDNCPNKLKECYLIQVRDDFSKVGPTALSNWSKPTNPQVLTAQTQAKVNPNTILPLPPPNAVVGGWLWKFFQPTYAYAATGGDNFNRTVDPLDGTWTNGCWLGSCGSARVILNGTIAYVDTPGGIVLSPFFTGFTASNNQEAQVTFPSIVDDQNTCGGSGYGCFAGPNVRNDGASNFYAADIFSASSYSEILIWRSNGTSDIVAQDLVTQWASGDKAKLRIVGDQLTLYRDSGAGFVSFLTNSNSELASGQPGMSIFLQYSPLSQVITMDDFIASDVAGAAVKNHPTVIIE